MDLGDRVEDATIDFKFSTRNVSAAPATLAGTPVLSVYKSNGTTESTAGVTLTVDFDARTGLNHVNLVTTDVFYAAGEDYEVVITTGTVNSVSVVGTTIATFSIENRFMRGTNLALLAASAPTNFSALGIESDGDIAKVNLLDGNTPQTGDNFARIGVAGAGLTNINLPNQTMDITGNVSGSVGSVTGSVGSVTGAVGSVTGNVGGNVAGSVNSVTTAVTVGTNNDKTGYTLSTAGILAIWNQLTSALTTASTIGKLIVDNLNTTVSSRATPAQVNTEVLDVFTVDTFAEPTSVPAATATLEDKIGWIAALARNKLTQTATTSLLRNDADSATIGTSTVSDDGTTAVRGEFI